jgi:hypothetical protein
MDSSLDTTKIGKLHNMLSIKKGLEKMEIHGRI